MYELLIMGGVREALSNAKYSQWEQLERIEPDFELNRPTNGGVFSINCAYCPPSLTRTTGDRWRENSKTEVRKTKFKKKRL